MDALLFIKSNHRGTAYMKEENKKIKREQNIKRTKEARGISVQGKRKIPEILELTNESIHVPKQVPKKQSQIVSNKPSRLELLREWRAQKKKEKALSEKTRKDTSETSGKENTVGKKVNLSEKTTNTKPQRILREHNTNVTYNIQQKDSKRFQKQSYAEWKKSQSQGSTIQGVQTRRTTRNKRAENKPNKIPPINENTSRNRPTTRSMKNNTTVIDNQKYKTKPKTIIESDEVKGKKNLNKKTNDNDENIVGNKSNDEKEISNKIVDSDENDNIPKKHNIFSVLSTSGVEDIIPVIEEHYVVQPLVTEKTEFQPPTELFTDFKFDQKVIMDAISDFIPTSCDPKEAKLFTTDITAIEKKDNDNDGDEAERKLDHDTENTDQSRTCIASKTPIIAFKEREGLVTRRTPTSTPKRLSMSSKRSSLTPNPMNFLHKNEDPVAAKAETPKSIRESKSTVAKVLPVKVEKEEESEIVKHYTNLVKTEEDRFKTNIDKWEKILEEESAPEEHQGNILAAIGQAQLFLRKRFNQFKELIELHKDKTAEKAALASDLDGFWEMIFYQVSDVHKRFDELDKLEQQQWVVEEEVQKKPVKKNIRKTQKVGGKKPITTKGGASKKSDSKKSEFAKFRQQMMAKKKAEEQNVEGDFVKILTPIPNTNKEAILTPLRRSVRNLPDTPKDAPAVSMIFPADTYTNIMENNNSHDIASPKEPSPDTAPTKETGNTTPKDVNPSEDMEMLEPLRRSTRKTPSKYRSSNFDNNIQKKPQDVACNLFVSEETETVVEKSNELDFTKYLSKTIMPGHPVQRDLLTCFNTPKTDKSKTMKQATSPGNLMDFASPIGRPPLATKIESVSDPSTATCDDLLLL